MLTAQCVYRTTPQIIELKDSFSIFSQASSSVPKAPCQLEMSKSKVAVIFRIPYKSFYCSNPISDTLSELRCMLTYRSYREIVIIQYDLHYPEVKKIY